MGEYLEYDGQKVHWRDPQDGKKYTTYNASSGMNHPAEGNFQSTAQQCTKELGPVPEGEYSLLLRVDKKPARGNLKTCDLRPSHLIQRIPRGEKAGECEPFWANWGENRVRFEPANEKTRTVCKPRRGGFYLHDSTKGYSHGCIEIDGGFFTRLYDYASKVKKKRSLRLVVKYAHSSTYGGTRK